LEKTMALNIFAPLLLSHLLLDELAKSPNGRIVNISSIAHKALYKPDLNDIQLEKGYSYSKAYSLSKLYLIWLSQSMASEFINKGFKNVTINSLEPGVATSSFGKNSDKGFLLNIGFKIFFRRPFFSSCSQAAKASIYLATSQDVENISGKFFNHKAKIVNPNTRYYSPENEKIVWDYCMKIISPYIKNNNIKNN